MLLKKETTSIKNNIVFCFAVAGFIFWILGKTIDVYKYILVGAIFEILWLPMLVGLFIIPTLSLWLLFKEKWTIHSLNIYTLLMAVATILVVVLH